MKIKKYFLFTIGVALGLVAYNWYSLAQCPIIYISENHTVQKGQTLWEICNNSYITENNVESFNEFLDRTYSEQLTNKGFLLAGQKVKVTNKIYGKK